MSPINVWSKTASILRVIGDARDRHAAAYPVLLRRFVDVYVRRCYSVREIVKLDLLDPRRGPGWFEHNTSKESLLRLQCKLNPMSHWILTEDKEVFYRFCTGADLPTPRCFGQVSVPRSVAQAAVARRCEEAASVFDRAEAQELIVKPIDGVHGKGVVALRREGGLLVDSAGVPRRPAEILQWLATLCDYETFIVQERLEAHESLRRLSGTRTLQTVRMVTYVTRNGEPVIGGCQLKIVGGDGVVDNFAAGRNGNLLGDVPAEGGRLSMVHSAMPGGETCLVERHPRTGEPFPGFPIPLWDEACALVKRAALTFLPLRTIGWDVALTPTGPVLIEGNVTWDPPQLGEEVCAEILHAIRSDSPPS
jgi:hypothetical protein